MNWLTKFQNTNILEYSFIKTHKYSPELRENPPWESGNLPKKKEGEI